MLTENILLGTHNVHGKGVRIHEKLEYRAKDRTVVRTCHIARQRLWGLLPVKETVSSSVLQIPEDITTEDQLRDFICRKRFWRRPL